MRNLQLWSYLFQIGVGLKKGQKIEIWVGGKKANAVMTIDEAGEGFFVDGFATEEVKRKTLTEEELRGLKLKKVTIHLV